MRPIRPSSPNRRLAAWLPALLVALAATPAAAVRVEQVRVGDHAGFTRIVLELDGPAPYTWTQRPGASGGELVVEIQAQSGTRVVGSRSRLVESVSLKPEAAGAVARVQLRSANVTVKEMVLKAPHRIVLDVAAAPASAPAPKAAAPITTTAPKKPTSTLDELPPPTPTSQTAPAPARTRVASTSPTKPPASTPTAAKPLASTPTAAKPATPTPSATKLASPAPTPSATKLASPAPTPSATKLASPAPTPTATKPASPAPTPSATKLASPAPTPSAGEPAAEPAPSSALAAAEPGASPESVSEPATAPGPRRTPDAEAAARAARPPAEPPAPEASPSLAERLGVGDPMAGLSFALGGVLILLLALVALRRRSARIAREAAAAPWPPPGAEERPEFATAREESAEDAWERRGDAGPLFAATTAEPEGDDAEPAIPAAAFQAEPEVVAKEADPSRVEELERRLERLEARLTDNLDARDRLERQLAAHTEELRVQRAAIARTQRAVRAAVRGPEAAGQPGGEPPGAGPQAGES